MNEIEKLIGLLDEIEKTPASSNELFGLWMQKISSKVFDDEEFSYLSVIYKSILLIESESRLRISVGHHQNSLLQDAATLEEMFDFVHMTKPATTWCNQFSTHVNYIRRNISSLLPLLDVENPPTIEEVRSQVAAIRERVQASEHIVDSDRSLLANILMAVEHATDCLEAGNLSEFRFQVYTAAGRLSVEIVDDAADKQRIRAMRNIADDILRIVGAFEVIGTAGTLIGVSKIAGMLR